MRITTSGAVEAGAGFLLEAARQGVVTITQDEAPVAVVVSAKDYQRLVQASRVEHFITDVDQLAIVMRDRREQLGWSLQDTARTANVGQRFVWDVEHAVSRPEAPMLLDLADALGIGLASFPARPRGPWTKALTDPMSDELPKD